MPSRPELRRLPNLISLSRLFLAAAFTVAQTHVRLAIVLIAATTDFLDGWIARRVHATSRSGALLDPIADRVFALVAISVFLFEGLISTGAYFVMISRDLMTALGFLVARLVPWLRPVEFKARWSGKTVTVLQFVTFVALLVATPHAGVLIVLVGLASAWAIVDYTFALWRARAPEAPSA